MMKSSGEKYMHIWEKKKEAKVFMNSLSTAA